LLFNFALEYTTRKVKENREGLELNGTHHLLFYAHNVNLLGEKTNFLKKDTEVILNASKEVGPEVNMELPNHMFMSRHHTTGLNNFLLVSVTNKAIEYVAEFRCLGMMVTYQNSTHEKIKSRLNSGVLATKQFRIFCLPVCYHKT
jgi:hypothetical protein